MVASLMADLDAEYEAITLGIHERFATVPEIKVILDYEPTTAQDSPLIFSMLDGFEADTVGTVTTTTWRTSHMLCIRWQDAAEAERMLRRLAVSLQRVIRQQPRLHGRVRGVADIVSGDAGFTTIGGEEYRSLELISEVLTKTQYPAS
jgi:hypothetical protein